MKLFLSLLIPCGIACNTVFAQTFTQITDISLVINQISNTKDGGTVWADYDQDGDLDLAVSIVTSTPQWSETRLYRNNNNGTFTDVTSTLIAEIGVGNECCQRSLLWGDLNNDGLVDLIGNTSSRLEIYLNRGTVSTPNYMFGVGSGMTPNLSITGMEGAINMEGLGLIDYNNDGWLDIIFENGGGGIDIFENQLSDNATTINTTLGDGGDSDGIIENSTESTNASVDFLQATTIATSHLGFPQFGNNGDYLALGDYTNDGYIDLLVRRGGTDVDLFSNDGDGTFTNTGYDFGDANNGNKGGAIFCDFDSDGDFDIFWTDSPTNQIWIQDPAGTFTATGQPSFTWNDVDGCACADVDGDGDIDLFLGNSTGNSYLFINNTTGSNATVSWSFSQTNIAVNANAEGVNLVDYDSDGDYDIYVNVNGGNNQLWENDLCDGGGCDYVKVVVQDCIDGSSVTRPVIGATLILKDDMGNIVSGLQDMNSAMGHGAQNPSSVFFNVSDPANTYTLDIQFPGKIIPPDVSPTVESYSFDFIPNSLTDNTLILTSVNATSGNTCNSVLPIELLYFKGSVQQRNVILTWATASESNNDFFTIERSQDGRMFYAVARIPGSGNTNEETLYFWEDRNPLLGWSYYRLKQTDFDGTYSYSQVIIIQNDLGDFDFTFSPNPFRDFLILRWSGNLSGVGEIWIYDLNGAPIQKKPFQLYRGRNTYEWNDFDILPHGAYIAQFRLCNMTLGSFKLLKRH